MTKTPVEGWNVLWNAARSGVALFRTPPITRNVLGSSHLDVAKRFGGEPRLSTHVPFGDLVVVHTKPPTKSMNPSVH